ncbi:MULTISPECIES: hypothetical protein [Fusobacterium]|uniref:hypothetical protein n=1 Tax=Fusobacterium TaxID=848 RepID=UPI001476E909|nr:MULTISPECIES: hypothetical protein [Fusobacterium]NME35797.1 hypothetical protein [Fusobacterium sp. FSA-380-WT-3A]
MSMTVAEAKIVVQESLDKLKESIKREVNYNKELADDKLTLKTLEQMKLDGEPLPEGCPYISYDEWIEQINKEIKSGENSIARIGKEKAEIMAFEYYISNGPVE